MSRYRPKPNSKLALAIQQANDTVSLEELNDNLCDLNRLHVGLESIEVLSQGLDRIDNGIVDAETLLDINRATHTVAEVFEDESIRPTSEITVDNADSISMEGIVSAAINAIIKILKWIITAPVRFVKWLFDKERVLKAKTNTVDKVAKAASETLKAKRYSTFTLELKHVPDRAFSIGDVDSALKMNAKLLSGFMTALSSDINEIKPVVSWDSLDRVESEWGNFKPKNTPKPDGVLWQYGLEPREKALPHDFRPLVFVSKDSFNDGVDRTMETSKNQEAIAREVFENARKEAKLVFDQAADLSKLVADNIVKLQKGSERLLRVLESPKGGNSTTEAIQQYSNFTSGMVGESIKNVQVLDRLVNKFDEHITSIINPKIENVVVP